ncbi:MAG: carbohydrate-binding domain-containing protein [Ruminococcus sp.]|nr:carbohydrate-binding domain-containing protein [Ruminococcus sp.]
MKKFNARKTAAGIMSLCLLGSLLTAMPMNASAALAGDVNEDGQIGIADIVSLQKHILGMNNLSASSKTNADLTADGRINVFDLAVLKGMVSEPVTDIIKIHLSDSGITVEGDKNGVVSINGKIATITASGNYIVDGSITEGQLLVNIPDPTVDVNAVEMTLTDVTMTNSTMPCIYSQSTDKLKINLVGTNTLTDNAAAAYTGMDGCIYALTDLTITKNSTGTLNVTSSLNKGIYSDKDLKLNGGTINVNTDVDDLSDADALVGDNTLSVDGATITVDSSADGLKSKGENVEIVSGNIEVKAGNDAVQAATSIDISGGTVVAGGDRGFRLDDAGLLNITGGDIIATATDYQITDATLSAATIDMSGSTQTVLFLDYATEQVKDQAITLTNGGTTAYEMTANKKFSYVIASSASLSTNATYNLYTGGVQQGHTNGTVTDFAVTANGAEFTAIAPVGGATVTPADDNTATAISYSGSSVTAYNAAGNALSSPSNLTIAGSTVTITVPSILSVDGSSTSAQIIVDCDKTAYATGVVELDLVGAELSNSSVAPIYVKQIGDECQIVAKNGYTNTISDGTSHSDTNSAGEVINGAIYSEDDLKIKGQGTLTVNGNTEDGIVCKNDLKIFNGTINVNAIDDAVRGNDSVTIGNDTDTDFSALKLTVNSSAGDGIKTNETVASEGEGAITVNGGTINITAYSDGMHASMALNVVGGDITIKTTAEGSSSSSGSTGGWPGSSSGSTTTTTDVSAKQLKAGCTDDAGTVIEGNISITGGTMNLSGADDCVHATNVTIDGGSITGSCTIQDGVHADNTLTINSGSINITNSREGLEGSVMIINGGTMHIVATDDGFNAAGGADDSGNTSTGGGFNPGNMSSSSGSLTINGGYMHVSAGGDGLDSNGTFSITGGTIMVFGPSSGGNGIFDCDSGITMSGGKLWGVGISDMFTAPSGVSGLQCSGSATTGTTFAAADSSGNVESTITVPSTLNMSNALVYYGSPTSSGLTVYSGGTYSGTRNEDGYGEGGTISGGSALSASSGGSSNRPF